LSEEFGGLLPDISVKVATGDRGDYEEAYMPIIQSGEQMNVRISAECDEKPLFLATTAKHSGVIFSSIGVRYQTFCANMARTFLVNPTESQKRYYTALEASLAAGIASCIVNNTFGQVFDAIVGVLSQTKDDSGNALDAAMFKIVGFGIGYELREDFADRAKENVEAFLGTEALDRYRVELRDCYDGIDETDLDRVVLDLPEPWQVVPHAAKAMHPGGILLAYTPSIVQVMQLRQALEQSAFDMPETLEVLNRTWHVEGLAVRPDHRMVAHTGFLTHARLLGD
jgi:hypothetical protein